MDFSALDALKRRLDSFRPLPDAVVRNLREDLILRWTYHSNSIEGNTLTLKETKVVLEGITVGGKSLREHLEAINHRDAIYFVERLLTDGLVISEWNVRNIHALVLKGIDQDNAGRYRGVNVVIAGARHRPPDHLQIARRMQDFVSWWGDVITSMHPVERAARVHMDFVGIHPFVDGNGRTSRLLMNLVLMDAGFPAIVVPVEDRLKYYEALDAGHVDGDYEPFFALTHAWVAASFDPYWHALGISA